MPPTIFFPQYPLPLGQAVMGMGFSGVEGLVTVNIHQLYLYEDYNMAIADENQL